MQFAELRAYELGRGHQGVAIGDVNGYGQRAYAERRDLSCRALNEFFLNVGEREVSASPKEFACQAESDALRRSGNEGYAPRDVVHAVVTAGAARPAFPAVSGLGSLGGPGRWSVNRRVG